MTSPSERSNRIAAFILYATVATAPLPFGSTDPATIAFWCVILGIALVVASPRNLRGGQLAVIGVAALIVTAYTAVLYEQLTTRAWSLSATPHPIWKKAAEALGIAIEPSVAISHNQPFFALGAPLAATLSLAVGLIICADHSRSRQLLRVVAWSGVAYAVFGIVSLMIEPTKLLWRDREAYFNVPIATFINGNTAAVYFGSCSVVWLLLVSESVRQQFVEGRTGWGAVLDRIMTHARREIVVGLLMLFVCLTAMLMTASRAGVVVSLIALLVAFTVFFRHNLPRGKNLLFAVVGAGVVALVLLQTLGASVSGRFEAIGFIDGGRLATYRGTWQMIVDRPWFGSGLGTFVWSFAPYRSAAFSISGIWDRAHNVALELAAELGLPLAALIVLWWAVTLAMLANGARVRRRNVVVPVAALSVAILALLHSLVDFSLQIPGFAIVVFALIGAGLAQSFSSVDRPKAVQIKAETPLRPQKPADQST